MGECRSYPGVEELASGAQGSEVDGGDRGMPKFYQVVQRETANLQGMALDLIFLFFFLMRFFGVLFEESEWKPSYVQCEFKQLQVFVAMSLLLCKRLTG